jgi:hypothetical protein
MAGRGLCGDLLGLAGSFGVCERGLWGSMVRGFDGRRGLRGLEVAGWRVFLLVDGECDRKTNQTPTLPSRESQRCHRLPTSHFECVVGSVVLPPTLCIVHAVLQRRRRYYGGRGLVTFPAAVLSFGGIGFFSFEALDD